jgi:uncharacterized delta-60 repeat protein
MLSFLTNWWQPQVRSGSKMPPRSRQAGRANRIRLEVEELENRTLLTAGALDPTFGTGGLVLTDLPPHLLTGSPQGQAVTVQQPDGKIVVVGTASVSATTNFEFFVARYNTDGTLDTTFGTGGVVFTAFNGSSENVATSVAIQANGDIVVAGLSHQISIGGYEIAVARYTSAGALDTTFGTGGEVLTQFGSSTVSFANSLAIQADGAIVVAGYSIQGFSIGTEFAVARYTSAGALDTTFGSGGEVLTQFGFSTYSEANSVAIQADGAIVVAGFSNQDSIGREFALARYTSAGALDTTFNSTGEVLTQFGFSTYSEANSVAIQADGAIVVAGSSDQNDFGPPGTEFAVARYTSAGALDTTFNSTGEVLTQFGSSADSEANSVAIQADGAIVVAGSSGQPSGTECAVARYTSAGALDTTFGTGGEVLTQFGSSADSEAKSVAIQANGAIVVAGDISQGFVNELALARYTTSGSLDSSFNSTGEVLSDLPNLSSAYPNATSVSIQQPDGKIVVVGYASVLTAGIGNTDFFVARYNTDGTLDTTFGTGGVVFTAFNGSGQNDATGVALQANGDIVVVGYSFQGGIGQEFAVARYTSSGALDTTFGTGGEVLTQFGSSTGGFATSVAIQANGAIVVAGSSGADFAVARYTSSGALDTTFGTGGEVLTPFGSSITSSATGVGIQSDGAIVVAGYSFLGFGSGYEFALARYTSAGALDTTFNSTGEVLTRFNGATYNQAFGMAIQSDGAIVVAGYSSQGSGFEVAVARYITDGTLDTTFGTGGEVLTQFGSSASDVANSLAIQSDGAIVVAGYSGQPSGTEFALARYTSAGALDTTFGTGGEVLTSFGSGTGVFGTGATSVTIQAANGDIVVAGTSFNGVINEVAIARYTSSGALDSSFNSTGEVLTDFPHLVASSASATSVSIQQPDGKIVVVGSGFSVARYNTNGTLDTGFGTGGVVFTAFNGLGINAFTGVALQSNGDIVVVGSSFQVGIGTEFAVARYTSAGALDTTFGTGGEVLTQFGSSTDSFASSVAIQADGAIVVAGSSSQPIFNPLFSARTEFAVARYTSAGALDTTFGTGGEVLTQFGSSPDSEANSVAIQVNGAIVVTGYSNQGSFFAVNNGFAVARYTTSGALDTTFAFGGLVFTQFGSSPDSEAHSVAIQADGAIVVAGYSNQGSFAAPNSGFAVARYTSAGALDTTFGFGRVVLTQFGSSIDSGANSVAIQADGAIVVAGYSSPGGPGREFALARYTSAGALDTTFNSTGEVLTRFGSSADSEANSVAIQADGAIVAAGLSYNPLPQIALARYQGTPALLTVTADNTSRYYGVANPTFTYTIKGFVNGDSSGVVSGAPTLTTTATASSPPGSYTIVASPGTLAAANYTFSLANGTLTVTPAPLSASAVTFSATAGAPFSGTVATFTNADPFGDAASYTATITWGDGSTSAGAISGTGSTLTVSGSHTYSDPVNRTVNVTISHNLGYTTTATVSGTATVTSLGQNVVHGLTGGIGFWHGSSGQALITSFNVTASNPSPTALASWLKATFPNLYGSLSLTTNADVAAYFQTLFTQAARATGTKTQVLAAQAPVEVLATALNVYATTASLGGTAGTAYGFIVSAWGLGAYSYNVGSDGAAFGVANNTTLTAYALLLRVNNQAKNGVLYGGNVNQLTLEAEAADLFTALNQAGGIG